MKKVATYEPLNGFYDLRAFAIPVKEFIKLWNVQKFLFKVEQDRRAGKIHPQIESIRDYSAKYQATLFQYEIVNESLI